MKELNINLNSQNGENYPPVIRLKSTVSIGSKLSTEFVLKRLNYGIFT